MTVRVPPQADEADRIRSRLQALENERLLLEERLRQLEQPPPLPPPSTAPAPTVTNGSSAADKIALFRRLFGGRTDVFPARWENPKSGKSGYAPACSNEWIRGVCGKPQVKCGDCPNKAFIPVTGDVIECHLRGEDRIRSNGRGGDFVAGVYPLLFDDSCNFLAVDFDDESWSSDALGVHGDMPRARCAGGTRAFAVRKWWTRLAVLLRACRSSRRSAARNHVADTDHEPPAGDRLQILRSALSEPRHDAERRLRQPDRAAAAAGAARERQQCLRR